MNGHAGAAGVVPLELARSNGTLEKLRRLDVAGMVSTEPPVVPWVIEGLVVRGALTVLNGREGEGKSLLAMALATGVARGETRAGMACVGGGVLIVDAENGRYETHRRVHLLDLPASVVMYELGDGQRFDLRSDLTELERLLAAHKPDLLILDSFRSLWGGEENDSGEVATVLDPLRDLVREHEAGTLLLHHSGKGSGSYRGSSAIGASAELGFTLACDEGDDALRSLTCWKCRPAPKPPDAWVRFDALGERLVVEQAEAPGQKRHGKQSVAQTLKPSVLAALSDTPRTRASVAVAVGRKPKDRTVGRILDDLETDGLAKRTGPKARPLWKVAGGNSPIGHLPPATLANVTHRGEAS